MNNKERKKRNLRENKREKKKMVCSWMKAEMPATEQTMVKRELLTEKNERA